jgi:hypothetical protein
VAANDERSRRHARFRAGFIWGEAGSFRKNVADSKQIAKPQAKSVAQEKEANTEENANLRKEKEDKSVIGKKEIKSIAESVTKEVAIAGTSFNVGGTNRTVADTARYIDASPHRWAINFARHHSASRGWEVRISRWSGLRTTAEPDAASSLVVLVATGSYLPVPFAVCAKW